MEARKKAVIILTLLVTAALLWVVFEWLADQTVPVLKEHVIHYVDQKITG